MRSSSPFDHFDRLEQQLSQQRQRNDRVPAAQVHASAEAYEIVLELPGVDKAAIVGKATDRTLVMNAESRSHREQPAEGGAKAPLMSEFCFGIWSRSFRFPEEIDRERLHAFYHDGLLTVRAPKAGTLTIVPVKVEG